jgi:preprotein translocase subunit SecE
MSGDANKGSFLSRASTFLKDSQVELRKVATPTRAETLQTTMIALVIIVFVALSLFVMDVFFRWFVDLFV